MITKDNELSVVFSTLDNRPNKDKNNTDDRSMIESVYEATFDESERTV